MTRPIYTIACFSVFLFTFFALQNSSYAQLANNAHTIYLKTGTINAQSNARQWLESNVNATEIAKDPTQVLVHFTTLPTDKQRELLRQSGITLLDYIPDNTFTALLRYPFNKDGLLSTPLYSIISTKAEWKADPYVLKNTGKQNESSRILISFYSNIEPSVAQKYIAGVGGQVQPGPMEKYGTYKVTIASNKIRSIAQWYGVRYVSPWAEMQPLDLQSRPALKGNIAVASAGVGGYELTGEGVTVGVGDNASGIYHADLKDRITNFHPGSMAIHGAHVNGIIGGAANIDPLAASMAPHVSLIDYMYDQVIPATGALYKDYNMTITNNSYGTLLGDCDYAGTYDIGARFLDTLSVQYPDVLHVFASGNDGDMNCSPYLPGFATTGGGYQPAKNDIVVGSITDLLTPAADESRGPVKDGRLKPEIVAIGLGAYSTINVDQYAWEAGTSMASPHVAGGLAILTQRYKQLNAGSQPKGDVLKTILLNGAMDLGNPGPDYSFGFGSMDLSRSLQMLDKNQYTTNIIANGAIQAFTITVPPNTAQLKVMLCWHDVPASLSSAKQLVNDLDLSVSTPSSGTRLPLILNPSPLKVNDNATEQEDHTNNVEQVTIINPAAGVYTVNTKGYNLPSGTQRYVLAYDMMPRGVQLTYPIGQEQLSNIDSIRVFWNTVSDGNPFTVELSTDNGGTWNKLPNFVPANDRFTSFMPTGINSGNCRMRIKRDNTSDIQTSERFAINTQPVIRLSDDQCPGYVNVHWSAVPNATSYILLAKKGPYMQVVGIATDTIFSFSGMSLTDRSYVAVQPVIDGIPGYRSVAVSTIANSGDCNSAVSSGDLLLEKVVSPTSGRMLTSTQLGLISPIQLKLRNLYGADCNNYKVSWQVNGGSWSAVNNPGIIPAKGTTVVTFPGLSLGSVGSYNINIVIQNLDLADPQTSNDSTSFTVLNLLNDPVDLSTPFADGFEDMAKISVTHDSIGLSPNAHWDFFNTTDTGRLRSFTNDDITITGTRSISLDDYLSVKTGSKNTFVGTFNLAAYDTANTEVRVDFDYLLHGTPKTADGNVVTARGSDTSVWSKLYAYDISAYPGYMKHVLSTSLTDVLTASRSNFSTSTQISFGQNDTSLIALTNYGNGITLDNFRIYTVTNDASLTGIVSPQSANCGLPASVPLIVKVHNGVRHTLYNVQLFYRFDGGPVYTGTIDSIKGKSDINYTFAQQLQIPTGATHSLNVWLTSTGDSYILNDSIIDYHIRNTQIITTYPYLENFENGDGGYYSDGINNSWQYGTPAAKKINRAASGTKAWKTNLTGNYNDLETSYLYSPCFDISTLANPMISFSTAMDIENCGNSICDAGFMEYSFDGSVWRRLGIMGQGTNWYDSSFNVWNTQNKAYWHVATTPIRLIGSGKVVHFRFVMSSDPGATFEGISLDDIHIYDFDKPIAPAYGITAVTKDVQGNEWNEYTPANQLLAAAQPNSQDIPNTEIILYKQDTIYNPSFTQYSMPRSYTVKSSKAPSGDVGMRLYLLDSEVTQTIKDTTCPSCTRLTDAYSLGITQYTNNNNKSLENNKLIDDSGGVFTYYPHQSIKWTPYDRGYIAEFISRPFSEYWFNNGGPTGNFHANADYLNFVAYRNGTDVSTYWSSLIDTAVNSYTIQRANDSIAFTGIKDTAAIHQAPASYSYTDVVNFTADSVLYYRLRWTMTGKKEYHYSPVRRIDISDSGARLITLDAQMTGHNKVWVDWTSYIDPIVKNYKLERAIGDREFAAINSTNAVHHYGQKYYVTDAPGENINTGTPVHYRLTATQNDGKKVILPIHTIILGDENSIINIYPNPTYDGDFTITWTAEPGTQMFISVSDLVGREVYKTNLYARQWDNISTLSTFRGPKGVYFVRIEIGGKRYVTKLVYE